VFFNVIWKKSVHGESTHCDLFRLRFQNKYIYF